MPGADRIGGVILAGGKGARMNYHDKALMPLGGSTLIEHVIALASPQTNELVISVNRRPERYCALGLPLIADDTAACAGPLVGICSSLNWLRTHRPDGQYSHLACFAADVPCFPPNFVSILATRLEETGAEVALCKCDGQLQPLFSLWSVDTLPVLARAIQDGLYGPKLVLPRLRSIEVDIPKCHAADFHNVNTEADLLMVSGLLRFV